MQTILDALAKLDVANDQHWTEEGLPRLESVRFFAGDQKLDRAAVTAAAPEFTRASVSAAAASAVVAASNPPAGENDGTDPILQGQSEVAEVSDQTPLEIARGVLTAAREAKRIADRAYEKANQDYDLIIEAAPKDPNDGLPGQLTRYFAAQEKIRQERAARVLAVKSSGLDLKALLTFKAPIDNAMARKTARGGQRPTKL